MRGQHRFRDWCVKATMPSCLSLISKPNKAQPHLTFISYVSLWPSLPLLHQIVALKSECVCEREEREEREGERTGERRERRERAVEILLVRKMRTGSECQRSKGRIERALSLVRATHKWHSPPSLSVQGGNRQQRGGRGGGVLIPCTTGRGGERERESRVCNIHRTCSRRSN